MTDYVILSAQLCAGLLAGIYLAFAVAVMPGLAATDDNTYVTVMRQINRAIVNPLFLLCFLGTPALSVAVGLIVRSPVAYAAVGFAAAALVITVAAHFPLNNSIEAAVPEQVTAVRIGVQGRWVRWHVARTAAGVGNLVCLLLLR